MRRGARAAVVGAAAIGLLACGGRSPAPVELAASPAPSPAPASAPRTEDPALAELAARAVYDDDFARRRLYTWTTVEQLAQLRASKELLVADAQTGGWSSPFHRALAEVPADGSPLAELARQLRDDPELRRCRYAWPNPFATTMGLGARRYGDALIEIELAPTAWIARFEPDAAEPLRVVDLDGAPVELERVAAAPERVAALFHVSGPPRERLAFREYVVCNEAMVAAWSIASADIRATVAAELALVEHLRARTLAQLPGPAIVSPAAPDWRRADPNPTALMLWHASLAFDNPRYRPGPIELDAIVATLAGLRDDGGPALRHTPTGASAARTEQAGAS